MTEIILELAAFLLALFCMIFSLRRSRELYFPLPEGLPGVLKDRHAIFLIILIIFVIDAVVSLVESVMLYLGTGLNMPDMLRSVHTVNQIVLLLAFGLYAFRLCSHRLSGGEAGKRDYAAVLLVFAIAVIGVVIQPVWDAHVGLFYEAVSLMCCMALFERGEELEEREVHNRYQMLITFAIVVIILAVIAVNTTLILKLSHAQSDELGNTQLDVIRSDLEDTINGAVTDVLRVAMGAEQLMESGASRETLEAYFYGQRDKYQSNASFKNVYIAGPDWHIVPDFKAPESFHAAERVWFIGAQDCPGEVFISEPYLDADDGKMCFTVSTLLSDGETVVGMDLNFSEAQESILRMTQGREQTAMIVTSGGLIAGYTDMSLVGERANEKLPEYAEVLRRVASSQEHDSFRVKMDGRPCMIFSSETDNGWYLILSVNTGTLYGESYRQIAILVSVNLVMLAVVLIYCLLSMRKTRLADAMMSAAGGSMNGFADRVREEAAHLLRLGDVRLFRKEEDPEKLLDRVRDSGEHLSVIAQDLYACSDSLLSRVKQEESLRAKDGADALKVPSRKVRNGIILSLLISLVIVLSFCISISTNRGTIRMNREADAFEDQLDEWLMQQKSILYMFTDVITSQPELISDYDEAVHWLAEVSGNYSDISLCYLANPYNEHPVIMSNGWEPGEDYRPESRPWYRATERSAEGFSISAPYLDAQSGTYCITLSRVVYGQNGEFLGIFGIDFFLDKLIQVLGESYTSHGYAFLVDSDGVIINHPNEDYQMGENSRTSVEDTEYAEACSRSSVTTLRDPSSQLMACLSRKTGSGFTVVVANRWWDIYGSVVIITLVFLVLFSVCLAFVISLINRLIRWQAEANRQLVSSAEEARSANRAKSQFLSQMSHEIRTPMNAIIGLNSIVLRDESISQRTREELEKSNASARHLLSLINDILDMSRIESGRMTLKADRFSFREFLEQVEIIVGGQCKEKGLQFVCNRVQPLDEWYVGDDLKLKQVIINILGNAVKFTDSPGVITFTVQQLSSTEENADLRFTMEDTGIGMDKEFIPKLFEAFSQEDNGTTNRYGGSGLGMAITKNILQMMGGEIHVESEKGLGSTFTVTVTLGRLPESAQPGAPAGASEAPAAEVSLEGRRVLIVEDQEMNAEILTDLLDMEEISSEWAKNGQLALELFAQREAGYFDAILMDMRMPVMDGLTATREIRKLNRPDAVTIPIIALTAHAFEEDVKQCLEAGMDAHLSKPVDIVLLKAKLAELLASAPDGGAGK